MQSSGGRADGWHGRYEAYHPLGTGVNAGALPTHDTPRRPRGSRGRDRGVRKEKAGALRRRPRECLESHGGAPEFQVSRTPGTDPALPASIQRKERATKGDPGRGDGVTDCRGTVCGIRPEGAPSEPEAGFPEARGRTVTDPDARTGAGGTVRRTLRAGRGTRDSAAPVHRGQIPPAPCRTQVSGASVPTPCAGKDATNSSSRLLARR